MTTDLRVARFAWRTPTRRVARDFATRFANGARNPDLVLGELGAGRSDVVRFTGGAEPVDDLGVDLPPREPRR
ncbi:hypothetical protein GCM10009872_29380 [Actinopolymorpha rutila]